MVTSPAAWNRGNAHRTLKEVPVTRTHSKIAVALAVAGAVLAVAVATAGAARHHPAATSIRLIGHETANAQLDLGAPGPSLGDETVFSGALLRPGGHRKIGHFEGTLTAVTPDGNSLALASVVLALPGGQITVQGELNFATQTKFVHAITGGTGAYRDATGEFHFHNAGKPGMLAITLQLDQG
jgi:hypothetical protein